MRNFFAELKRRKVYSVAVTYAVAGWALAQGIAQVLPVFDIPNWVVRLIVLLIVLGFPVALILSWFFDLTRYGIVRTPDRPEIEIDLVQPISSNEKSIAVLPFADLSPGLRRRFSRHWRRSRVCALRRGDRRFGSKEKRHNSAKSRSD